MAIRWGRAGWPRFYGEDGKLRETAIVGAVRRVWWANEELAEVRRGEELYRCKVAPLAEWYTAARWPDWWPPDTWVDCGDRLEARTRDGELWVRRRLL